MGDVLLKFTDFFVLFIACIGIVVASIYIFFYCKVKEIHKSPGDIYLGMCCGEMVFVIHAAIFSIINLEQLYDYDPNFKEGLCYTNLITFTFAVSLIYAYTIQQYLFMIFKLLYSLQTQKLKNWLPHVLTWTFALLFSGTSILTYDLYGCGKGSVTQKAPYTFIILLFSFYAMAITTQLYIGQQVEGNEKGFIEMHGGDFRGYINKLFKGQAALMTLFILFSMTVFLLKENEAKSTKKNTHYKTWIDVFTCLGEVSAVLYPVVIPIIRLTDPFLLKHLKEYYYNLPGENPKVKEQELGLIRSSSFEDNLSKFLLRNGENPEFFIPVEEPVVQQKQEKIDEYTKSDLEDPFMDIFQINRRSEIIKKMIALILLPEYGIKDDEISITERTPDNDFTKAVEYKVPQEVFQKYFKEQLENLGKLKQTNNVTMTQYAPEVFKILINNDLDNLNIKECLDMKKNERELTKCAQGKGGKSGEFFFFNYNNKLLLKTATAEELLTLKKMLESYFWHCAENPNTLIAKIIGIYTFEGFDIGRTTLIMMKNIAKVNRKAFLRVYDLKGSTYDRQVYKNKQDYLEDIPGEESTQNQEESGVQIVQNRPKRIKYKHDDTLKDKDFPNIDYTLKLSKEDRDRIFEQLNVDTLYFKSQGFMDYSLCIIVADWKSFLQTQHPNLREDLLREFMYEQVQQRQNIYKNQEKDGQYYHLGIIDYLQVYNLQKFTEKYAKKVIKFNPNLDTSAQAPQDYRDRFLEYQKYILDLKPYRKDLEPSPEIKEIMDKEYESKKQFY